MKLKLGNLHSAKCIFYLVGFEKIEILQYENKWDTCIMIDIAKKLKNIGAAFIEPPKKIPLFLKIGIAITKKITKKDLLVPKLLA